MSYTMVYYHIPEDFDDPEQPNAFGIGKTVDEIKLSDVKRLFPIVGTYHFRFKHVSNKTTLWMDLNDDDSKAISYQGKIVIKATRISWDSPSNQPAPSNPIISQKTQVPTSQVKPSTFDVFGFDPSPQKYDSAPLKYEPTPQRKVEQFDLLFPS
jgi:hypothetical protein